MDDKLKRVIELANELNQAVAECKCVISVSVDGKTHIRRPEMKSTSGVHISSPENHELDGLYVLRRDFDGTLWIATHEYGVALFGAAYDVTTCAVCGSMDSDMYANGEVCICRNCMDKFKEINV